MKCLLLKMYLIKPLRNQLMDTCLKFKLMDLILEYVFINLATNLTFNSSHNYKF